MALWTVTGGTLGEMLSLALNAVGFIACGMVWNASRVFHGRKPNLPGLVLGAIAWIAAVMTVAPAGSTMRVIDRRRHCHDLRGADGHRIVDRAPPLPATALAR